MEDFIEHKEYLKLLRKKIVKNLLINGEILKKSLNLLMNDKNSL